ncbi:MAG TPA: gamma-glutamyltransferase [Gaiellales bacterium]|nr:gamma-glutamyltransferase [Gaiellales bacterium]
MHGAVAAGHRVTAEAGAAALAAGGNAVDAVVAAGVMSWAAEPGLTGPCGGGFVLVRPGGGRPPALLDAFTAIPGRELPAGRELAAVDHVVVPFDEQTTQSFHIGPAACAVPGVVAGLFAVHSRYGRLPWRDLLMPAAEAAERGVGAHGGQYAVLVAIRAILEHTPEVHALFSIGGRFVAEGDPIRQPDLAASIAAIAERGPAVFYTGDLARAMVAHQGRTGGRLTAADLASYRPVWRRPLRISYADRELVTNPPPSSGGVLIGHSLAVLDGAGRPLPPGRAATLRAYAEAMRSAARLRDRRFERLLHRGGLAGHVLSPAAVAAGRAAVAAALRGEPRPAAAAVPADAGTTHVSVVDRDGNAAAFTASNGCHSGVVVPGTGLHLNNMMGEDDLSAGRHLAPGTRLTSMQSPSVVTRGGAVELVLGSSGSNRLRSAILQVAVNVVDHGMTAREAVDHPRIHVEGDRLDCEGGIDLEVLAALEAWGERVNRFDSLNLYFGGANAVRVHGGGLDAAGDPRRDGHGVVL